jgi:hypothetical protein
MFMGSPRIGRAALAWLAAFALAACQQALPPPVAPAKAPAATAPAPPMTVAPAIVVPPGVVLPSLDFPPGPLYACVVGGARSAIDYEPRVEQLCRRHPEMGPCQYERNACRAKGGRVLHGEGRGGHAGRRVRVRPHRAPRALPGRRRAGQALTVPRTRPGGAGARTGATGQTSFAANVLQLRGSPVLNPVRNHRTRCSALPCVNASGTT